MAKGLITQGACILLERPVSLDEIAAALGEFEILDRIDAQPSWEFGGPTLIVNFDAAGNGKVAIDLVERPWPDHMGDPQQEPTLFGAWSMGQFGPHAFPHGLFRAAEQCWTWEEGATMPARHTAFIRVRSSYAFGASEDDPVIPENYDSLGELEFVTKIASALLDLPAALCYFNPNGETLRNQDDLRESLNYAWANELPPLDVWSNIRLFNVNPEWSLMDTVGNGQLDLPDAEAVFHSESYDFNEVDHFLRNVSLYLLQNGEVIDSGDTMDGPGTIRWRADLLESGVCDPPRNVLRWNPLDDRPLPAEILNADHPDE